MQRTKADMTVTQQATDMCGEIDKMKVDLESVLALCNQKVSQLESIGDTAMAAIDKIEAKSSHFASKGVLHCLWLTVSSLSHACSLSCTVPCSLSHRLSGSLSDTVSHTLSLTLSHSPSLTISQSFLLIVSRGR